MKHFELNVMNARVKLAAIDHNNNVGREQDVVKKERKGSRKRGEKKWKFQCVKVSKDWTAKPVKVPKSYEFVDRILIDIFSRKNSGVKVSSKRSGLHGFLSGPKNIAPTERPDTEVLIKKREILSRFKT